MPKVKVVTDEDDEDWGSFEDDGGEGEETPVRSGSLENGPGKGGNKDRPSPPGRASPRKTDAHKPKGSIEKAENKRTPGKKRAMGVFKWTARVLFCIIIVFLLFAPGFPFHEIREATGLNKLKDLLRPYREFPEWVNVSMEMVFDLSVSNGEADEVHIQVAPAFDIPLVQERGDDPDFIVQDVTDIELTPEPTVPFTEWDTERNKMTGWDLENVRGVRQYRARFDAVLRSHTWTVSEEGSGTIEDIPQPYRDAYLDDEWTVERAGEVIDDDNDGIPDLYRYHPSHPTIQRIAKELTRDETTVFGMVENIYKWVREHFNYTTPSQRLVDEDKYGSYPKYPIGTINDWYGDCDDQSLLMASLCRAVGIPAWLEIGYLYDPAEGSWGGHGWFNVYIPLKDGDHVIAPIDPVNSEFLFRDPYRITDWIDTGGLVNVGGEEVFNLDHYYNFFTIKRSSGVAYDIEITTNNLRFEKHGKLKMFVDERIEPGNLPGSQTPLPAPAPSALLLSPLLILVMVPPVRVFLGKRARK